MTAKSVDLESQQEVTTDCGIDILSCVWDVRRIARVVTRSWWRLSAYKSVLTAIETKLHEVSVTHTILMSK
jgi:hypothetical protein